MKLFLNKTAQVTLFVSLFALLFSTQTALAVWSGEFYNPGETFNPECLPAQANCDVLVPFAQQASLFNYFFGKEAGNLTMTGTNNTALGYQALRSNTTGADNTALGHQAMYSNTTGTVNVATGSNALYANTTGSSNVAYGVSALLNNSSGSSNTALGTYSLLFNNGDNNVALGYNTLRANTSGDDNVAIGHGSLLLNDLSSQNIAIGSSTLSSLNGAGSGNNTAIGYNTGIGITSGANNTIIGANVTGLSGSLSNNIIIADGEGNRRINVNSTGLVGIGTNTPTAKLHVDGTVTPSGSELITNGTFTGGTTGWTLGGNVAYGTNNIVSSYVGGDSSFSISFPTVSGNTYLVSFDISSANAPVQVSFDEAYAPSEGPFSGSTVTFAIQTSFTGTDRIYFDDWNYVSGDTFTIDNVSIKQFTTATSFKVNGFNGANWLSLGGDIKGNTAVGNYALTSNTTGSSNSAFGDLTLFSNTTGAYNSAFGSRALYFNTTGSSNVAIGYQALLYNTTGNYNVAIGRESLYSNTTGSENIAIGYRSLRLNTTGTRNTAYGYTALAVNTTGTDNSAFGYAAGVGTTTGIRNTAIGVSALSGNTTGSQNTAIGTYALLDVTTGSNNVGLGYNAGRGITTGSGNIIIGANVTGLDAALTNNIVITDGVGTRRILVDSAGKVSIGTEAPLVKLDVGGSGRFTGATTSVLTGSIDPIASTTVTGVGTLFTTELVVGDRITVTGQTRTVTAIASATSLTVDTAFSDNANDTSVDKLAAILLARDSSNAVQLVLNDLGKVGIGLTTPSQALDVVGSMALTTTTSSTTGVIYKGASSFIHNFALAGTDGNNTFVGISSGNFTMTGSTGGQGSYNTAIGTNTLPANTTGYENSAFGSGALQSNTTGYQNVANGMQTLNANTTGYQNTAIGYQTLFSNTEGYYNTANGYAALSTNTTGIQNTATGFSALNANTTGNNNVGIGFQSLFANTTGYQNTAVGVTALADVNIIANDGTGANTAVGYNTGRGITTGVNNTIIGANVAGLAATLSNRIIIADGAGNQRIYVDNSGYVGLGDLTPESKLDVEGDVALPISYFFNDGNNVSREGIEIQVGADDAAGTNVAMRFKDGDGTVQGTISFTAGTTAYNTSSDIRLKENIVNTHYGLNDLMKINVHDYNFISDANHILRTGFIAQELQTIYPDAVTIPSNTTDMWAVDYGKLTPLLTKSIQELNLNLEGLSGTITPLAGSLNESFVTAFFNNLYTKIGTWLADAGNGIVNIFAKQINTNNLCISNEAGETTCVTKAQLDALLLGTGTSPAPVPSPSPAPTPTPEVTPEPEVAPTPEPTPEVTPEPTPELVPEPTPEVVPEPTPDPTPAPEPAPVE